MDIFQQQELTAVVKNLRSSYKSGKTRDIDFRLKQLKGLLRLYEEREDEILQSLYQDMRKSRLEGYLYEVDLMKNECREAIKFLNEWTSKEALDVNLLCPMDKAYILKEPLGLVLILGPWNYPWQLTLVPLAGAIAAGNVVIVKPSEISYHSAAKMAELMPQYLDPECYRVLTGGPELCKSLLTNKFDFIFYTGSAPIAKEIYRSAVEHLTPCCFELGGKSPVYLDSSANMKQAAERVMWGKCMNLGQTCIAPDYVLVVDEETQNKFVMACKAALTEWYGGNMQNCVDIARVINKRHFKRLQGLIKTTSGSIALGGNCDEKDLWVEPTVLVNVQDSDPVMQEEIFGPILAIRRIPSLNDAIDYVNSRPKPLCLYVFTDERRVMERFQNETHSGTMAINDTIVQFAVNELPFGGVGESGFGAYHGKFSFDTFTHKKGVVERDFSWVGDQVGIFRYPPYNLRKIQFLSFLLHHWKFFKVNKLATRFFAIVCIAVILFFVFRFNA